MNFSDIFLRFILLFFKNIFNSDMFIHIVTNIYFSFLMVYLGVIPKHWLRYSSYYITLNYFIIL